MHRQLGALVAGLAVMTAACGTATDGVEVKARQDVQISDEPLGDVVIGSLDAGDTATAVCFVAHARTNTGVAGTAVQVEAGRVTGYAAATDFPDDAADRTMTFDLDEGALRERLPPCTS